jgi:hypothetical protein
VTPSSVARQRLANQQLVGPRFRRADELVAWFGAVQAQDLPGGQWAIGQRLPDATAADVEEAAATRRIVRTWPMRSTLHYVAAADARWMLRLLTPRMIARMGPRLRQLEVDAAALQKSRRLLEKALRGGKSLTRPDAYALLDRGGVATADQRGIHIFGVLAMQGHVCFGARSGKQPTFVLLEEWLPPVDDPPRDEALGELARRYFRSHAPATLADFTWWTGLTVAEARRAVEVAGRAVAAPRKGGGARTRTPQAALLPPWDEYLVAYRDRADAMGHLGTRGSPAAMLIGSPLLLVDGRVRGTWKRTLAPEAARVALELYAPLSAAERRAVERAAARYGRFLGREVELRTSSSASRRSP